MRRLVAGQVFLCRASPSDRSRRHMALVLRGCRLVGDNTELARLLGERWMLFYQKALLLMPPLELLETIVGVHPLCWDDCDCHIAWLANSASARHVFCSCQVSGTSPRRFALASSCRCRKGDRRHCLEHDGYCATSMIQCFGI